MDDSTASGTVDFYDSTYAGFQERVRARIRRDTYGEDIGQNSWLTADELREFIAWLELTPSASVLEIAVGSGGPALFLARTSGVRVVGIDVNAHAIVAANEMARDQHLDSSVRFECADASRPLSFQDGSFDALLCIDAINHLPDRATVLQEWHRLLRPGGRLLYTDPIVVTGQLTNEEIATRSSIGYFVFTPRHENDRLLSQAGFAVLRIEDRTEAAARISRRGYDSRDLQRADLLSLEGQDTFEGVQRFLAVVHALSSERRLSRFAFLAARSPA